jgi:hypothetical protein
VRRQVSFVPLEISIRNGAILPRAKPQTHRSHRGGRGSDWRYSRHGCRCVAAQFVAVQRLQQVNRCPLLMSNTMITPLSADIATTTAVPANSAPPTPALALLSPEAGRPIQIAPASDVSRVTPPPGGKTRNRIEFRRERDRLDQAWSAWTTPPAQPNAPWCKQHGTAKDRPLLCPPDRRCSTKIGRHNSHILSANLLVLRPHRLRADASDATLPMRSGRRDI